MNPDGTYNVYCRLCHKFIMTVQQQIGASLCVICDRAEQGLPLSAEALADYNLSKAGREDVSMLLVPPEPPAGIAKKFSLRTMAGDIMHALGFVKPEKEIPKSAQVARSKKRGRLFEQTDLGTMDQIEQKLGEKR